MLEQWSPAARAWIEGTYEALGRVGLDGIDIDAVAAQLGVPEVEFYEHFEDHTTLLNAVLDYWQAIATSHFERHVDIADPAAQIRAVAKTFILDDQLRRADRWLLFHDPADPALAERAQQARGDSEQFITAQLAKLGFDEEEIDLRALVLYTGYLGLLAELESPVDTIDYDEACRRIDDLVDLVTAGVRTDPTP